MTSCVGEQDRASFSFFKFIMIFYNGNNDHLLVSGRGDGRGKYDSDIVSEGVREKIVVILLF